MKLHNGRLPDKRLDRYTKLDMYTKTDSANSEIPPSEKEKYNSSLICVGIEGTAHTIGIAVVERTQSNECRVLSNIIDSYKPYTGGIHPREAANHHADKAPQILQSAVEKSGISWDEIGLVAYSKGPGLGPCLRTAATAARSLALTLDMPLIGVNHCVAHLEIGCATTKCSDPVLLYVSGGNTQVIAFSNRRYRVFGETLDIGVGNMLDKLGRELGMPFPAGPEIERRAAEAATATKDLIDLPYSVKGMDVAFSGILTAAINLHRKGHDVDRICYSVQETVFAMLTEVTERAMAHVGKNEVLLGGGVACNARLKEMVGIMARERGAEMFVPEKQYCVDNGAMIAWLGILMHDSGISLPIEKATVNQTFRTDDVDVLWR